MHIDVLDLLHPRVCQLIAQLKWQSFRPVQDLTIQAYFRGKSDIAVGSSTGSGKTEAAVLPAFSDLLSNPVQGFGILWISPLRALINDGYGRLHPLGAKLDIPVHRWHKDVSSSAKAKARRSPDGLLLITPESLEANLILHRDQVKAMFAQVKVVVLDELHALLDTERGQHVQSLLARLFSLIGRRPRLIALSATLGDFVAACRFLNPDSPDSVEVVNCEEDERELRGAVIGRLLPTASVITRGSSVVLTPAQAREISISLSPSAFKENLLDNFQLPLLDNKDIPDPYRHVIRDLLHVAKLGSNLAFFNRRALLESFADHLHHVVKDLVWPEGPFFHHHSSLSKEVRERAEMLLKIGRFVTVLATSSLELGIDMKSVLTVLQIHTAFTVSSLKQRTGRSGRDKGQARRLRQYTFDHSPNEAADITDLLYPELLRGIAMVELMLSGRLEPSAEPRLHLSTLLHEVMALLRQEGPLNIDELRQRLCVVGPFRKVEKTVFSEVLDAMLKRDLLTRTAEGRMVLGATGEDITNSHDFFAVFSTEVEFEVFHGQRPIGKIPITWSQREGSEIILDGRRWIIQHINRRARRVTVTPSDRADAPVFLGRGGDIHDIIVQEMREVLRDPTPLAYLDAPTRVLLEAARITGAKAGLVDHSVLVSERGIYWFPWRGTKGMLTLSLAAQNQGLKCRRDALALYYPALPVERFIEHLKRIATGELEPRKLAALLPEKKYERYDDFLTEDLLITAAASDRLNLSSAQQAAVEGLQELTVLEGERQVEQSLPIEI